MPLRLDELTALAAEGSVDTVIVALTDMQGRLQGKRCSARYFLDEVVPNAAEACTYLLAVDVEMRTVGGYSMSSWDRGYGDFVMRPDFATLRVLPWAPATALVLCDVEWADRTPVAPSPRQVLKQQVARLEERGLVAFVGTELEFIVFNQSYEEAWSLGYDNLTPANLYNGDYSIIGTGRVERLLRRIRNEMTGAGMYVESAKGECNLGQHEVTFRFSDAITTCDNHVIYKTGAKEIAHQEGMSLTFMPKWDEREGNSCHIHISFRSTAGGPVMAGDGEQGFSAMMGHFIAGQLACAPEMTYFYAPNVNSYKRFVPGSFAPRALAWGRDNRTCALRVVGHGPSLRAEWRVPGGDVNPYLAVAALIAAGLHGMDNELEPPPEFVGNAYEPGQPYPCVPGNLRDAARLLQEGKAALNAFGRQVIDHYSNAARVELEAFDSAVTDWERPRVLSASEPLALPPPLIGLSTYVETARHGAWDENCALLPYSYVEAVARAGGCPVLLPPFGSSATDVLEAVDGLVLTGGPDVDPRLYGSSPHHETDPPRESRDAWEMALCQSALQQDMPLLAVCRGLQLLNVSLGGTLHQHLPEVLGHETHRAALGQTSPNLVILEPGSTVASILGTEAEGLCHHHQGVDQLGGRLRAVGVADDGSVEAVEVLGSGFAVGVQWHPEEDRADGRLFVALVEAARGHAKGRRARPSAQLA